MSCGISGVRGGEGWLGGSRDSNCRWRALHKLSAAGRGSPRRADPNAPPVRSRHLLIPSYLVRVVHVPSVLDPKFLDVPTAFRLLFDGGAAISVQGSSCGLYRDKCWFE